MANPIIVRIAGEIIGKVAKATFMKKRTKAMAKINRLKKKGFDVSEYLDFDLGKEINFTSRKEYNAWKKAVDKFTNKNNYDFKPKTVKMKDFITGVERKFEYLPIEKKKLAEYTKDAITRAVEKRESLKDLPLIDSKGNILRTVREQMDVLRDKNRGFIKEPSMISPEDLPSRESLLKRIEKMKDRTDEAWYDARNEQLRDNFITLLRRGHGDKADRIIQQLRYMDLDEFIDLFMMSEDMSFDVYDSDMGYLDNDEPQQLERLQEVLHNYHNGTIKKSLQGFKDY